MFIFSHVLNQSSPYGILVNETWHKWLGVVEAKLLTAELAEKRLVRTPCEDRGAADRRGVFRLRDSIRKRIDPFAQDDNYGDGDEVGSCEACQEGHTFDTRVKSERTTRRLRPAEMM